MNPTGACTPADAVRVLTAVAQPQPTGRPAHQLAQELRELTVVINLAHAALADRLADFDAQGGASVDGLSSHSWVRHQLRVTNTTAASYLTVARHLRAHPSGSLASSMPSGEVSLTHAVTIARTVTDVPIAAAPAVEDLLVHQAREVGPADLVRAAQRVKDTLAPDTVLRDAHELHDARHLHVSETLGGAVRVDGTLDPENGASVLTVLRSLAMPEGPDDVRSAGQRNADALGDACRRLLDTETLPDDGGSKPQLVILMTLEDLHRTNGGLGHLDTGGTLTGEDARRLACDCGVTRIITDGRSQPLDVGRSTRVIPAAIRRALFVRDGGCKFPGCGKPARWCDAHHIIFWAYGGHTTLINLVLLCRRHHRLVHSGTWSVVPDGCSFTVIPTAFAGRAPPRC